MYDGISFDKEKNMLRLADVGLMGLYLMDCRALAELATALDRTDDARILAERERAVSEAMERLWSEEGGFFYNRDLSSVEFSERVSPTNFYALFSDRATPDRRKRMMEEHFYNEREFWGDYIMPSIGRSDPAYGDQDYWRGRIWAPLNFLVYLAMRKSGVERARKDLARKSRELLLREWREKDHVHENYNGTTGEGCDVENSDKFYHWGALLALISMIEEGVLDGPEKPLPS